MHTRKILALGLSAMLLFALLALQGCASPIREEISDAKKNIAGTSPNAISEAWVFLAQNADDKEAQAAIDSLGGLPTPFTNLEALYRMGGTGRVDWEKRDIGEQAVEGYLRNALGLTHVDVGGLTHSGSTLSSLDTSNPYISTYCTQLFGDNKIQVLARSNSWYFLDDSTYDKPTYFELFVQGDIVSDGTTDDEAYGLLDSATDLAGLGTSSSKGFAECPSDDSDEGWKGKLWFTHGKTESGTPWYALLNYKEANDGWSGGSLQIFVSDCFSWNASAALEEFGEFGVKGFEENNALFSGHQEGEAPASSSNKPSSSSNTSNTSSNHQKDELITDANGKKVWKVWATSSTIHFTGTYEGQGNFIVKVLDSNQDLEELVCNEIGDWTLDKSVSVTPGKMYYIQIECTRGSWEMQWTGTGGA